MDYPPTATAEDGLGRSITTAEKGDGEHPAADGIEMGATKLAWTETVDDSPIQPIKVNGV
jgi:hypothetical protein